MQKWIWIFLVLIGNPLDGASIQKPILKPGPFKVGFKAGIHYDMGRPPLSNQFARFRSGRAVHLSVWYPAIPKANHQTMLYGEYVDLIYATINPLEVTRKTRDASIQRLSVSFSEWGGDSLALTQNVAAVMNMTTTAYRNAKSHAGVFPIVIYPSSPYLNSMFCEFLASYGYIVVTIPSQTESSAMAEKKDQQRLESMVQDIQFALSVVRREFNGDADLLAAIGADTNAVSGLAWMIRNPAVGAMIDLNGALLDKRHCGIIKKSAFFDSVNVDRPMLIIRPSKEDEQPEEIYEYPHADRILASLRTSDQTYYVNFGGWRNTQLLANQQVNRAYLLMVQGTLAFLDWHLKQGYHGRDYFQHTNTLADRQDELAYSSYPRIPSTLDSTQ